MGGQEERGYQEQPGDDLMRGEGIGKPLVEVDQNLDEEKLESEEAKEAMGLRIAEKWPGKGEEPDRYNNE